MVSAFLMEIMDRFLYVDILKKTLLPFIEHQFSDGRFLAENDIYWWCTPAESPDLNPIENLWHELKEFIRREVKPKKKDELVDGIKCFWETVDLAKCRKYIGHIHKVIPKVIELEGAATGY